MVTGPMQFGFNNNAGNPTTAPNQTILRAQIPNIPTLVVQNEGATSGNGVHVEAGGLGDGVRVTAGSGPDFFGVYAEGGTGVAGRSTGGGNGVTGHSPRRNGVQGVSQATFASGVYGENMSGGGFGVAGRSNVPPATFPFPRPYGAAVYGDNTAGGAAGEFNGHVRVNGSLTKSGGGFAIDSPVDPANRVLCHSFVESPDMMNIYNGDVTTDNEGNATVDLPEYFEALNRNFRYQLTVVGQFAQAIVADEIRNNTFRIRTDKPEVRVSWQVTGIRHDAWANAHRMEVDLEKPESERGRYLAPEEHGQPATAGIFNVEARAAEE